MAVGEKVGHWQVEVTFHPHTEIRERKNKKQGETLNPQSLPQEGTSSRRYHLLSQQRQIINTLPLAQILADGWATLSTQLEEEVACSRQLWSLFYPSSWPSRCLGVGSNLTRVVPMKEEFV